ncbi:hypothetical protein MTR67_012535 [Solanum verrucosum]|uniref:Uncharacterized protein n=1 Tax=Solanum verrucosum TaxID=315347 RepID=A0AAF0TMZ7_SOLVR|nr:hypothetical protein MTR67_012535 [Solanum verrucosum]
MFIDKRKIMWVQPGRIKEVLRSWNRDGNVVRKEKIWKMVPACICWTNGKRGIIDVLKTKSATYIRLGQTA